MRIEEEQKVSHAHQVFSSRASVDKMNRVYVRRDHVGNRARICLSHLKSSIPSKIACVLDPSHSDTHEVRGFDGLDAFPPECTFDLVS